MGNSLKVCALVTIPMGLYSGVREGDNSCSKSGFSDGDLGTFGRTSLEYAPFKHSNPEHS